MKNLSIHFTINGQTIEQVRELYKKFIAKHPELSFSTGGYEVEEANKKLGAYHVLNHCFMPKALLSKKGYPLDVPLFFESIATNRVCYFGTTSQGLPGDREAMIRNVKLSNGTCVFLGKINGGVKEELAIAEKWGCNVIKQN